MIIVLVISLYMSRVVLDKLGTSDYGVYSSVTSVVTMLMFLNGTLSAGTSRFITFELGTDNQYKLKETFTTAFFSHLILAVCIVIIMEAIGPWFLNNKLIIAEDRLQAANFVFHLSVINTFFSIIQIPYTATIIAHEDMNVYAYISILDAFLKLMVAILMSKISHDRLISYSVMMTVEQIFIASLYCLYASRKYIEARLSFCFNKLVFKNLIGFTSWNLLANMSETIRREGSTVVLNMFFQPVIVAAQAIASQVAAQTMQLYNNFKTALDPQIVKLYASGEQDKSRQLVLRTTVYVFDMCLLIGLPLYLLMEPVLHLWLVEVPEYAVIFAKLLIIQNVINSIQNMFYSSLIASAKLKTNSIAGFILVTISFIVLYFLFKSGKSVLWVQYIYIIIACLQSFLVRPLILYREVGYNLDDIYSVIYTCVKVTICSLLLSVPFAFIVPKTVIGYLMILVESLLSVLIASYVYLDYDAKLVFKSYFHKIKIVIIHNLTHKER